MAILRSQKSDNDCGPTCFSNALNILGYNIKIEQANKLCNLQRDGTDSDDLLRAFRRYGFFGSERTHYSKKRAWKWLMDDTNKGLPVIISVDDNSHWLLVLRAGEKYVQILDPDDDMPSKITRAELLDRWQHFEDKRDKPIFHGLALEPFKEKSIKAVEMRAKILSTADVR